MKIHHALVDGKSALAVALLLLDLDPHAPEPAAPPERGRGTRAAARRGSRWTRSWTPAPSRCARSAARRARRDRPLAWAARCGGRRWRSARTWRARRRRRSSTIRSARGERSSATRCRSRGCSRSSAPSAASLNDVALAVVAGALRRSPCCAASCLRRSRSWCPCPGAARARRRRWEPHRIRVHHAAGERARPARRGSTRSARRRPAFKGTGRAGGGETLLQGLGLLPSPLQAPVARASRRRRGCTTSWSRTCPGRGCRSTCSARSAWRCCRRSRSPKATRSRSGSSAARPPLLRRPRRPGGAAAGARLPAARASRRSSSARPPRRPPSPRRSPGRRRERR